MLEQLGTELRSDINKDTCVNWVGGGVVGHVLRLVAYLLCFCCGLMVSDSYLVLRCCLIHGEPVVVAFAAFAVLLT